MTQIDEAIKNLETSVKAIDCFLNDPKNYNSIYSQYLEDICWEMHKSKNELSELQYKYGT